MCLLLSASCHYISASYNVSRRLTGNAYSGNNCSWRRFPRENRKTGKTGTVIISAGHPEYFASQIITVPVSCQCLVEKGYADKTVYGALTLAKQVFKWGFQEGRLREYRLGAARIAKAKARPQPCFTTDQVELIVANSAGVEKAALATLAYAGLRIGELEQLQWPDVELDRGDLGMFHIRRGGSSGTTKDKEHRFVPISPRIRPLLEALPRVDERVFPDISERKLLKRLKQLCGEVGLANPKHYKLHSFRHHFASMCANHGVAHRKALAWLGHSSSDMLDLYYHLHDADSQAAMKSLADDTFNLTRGPDEMNAPAESPGDGFEGALRAPGQSTIEKTPQAPEVRELVYALCGATERAGFEPAVRE